MALQKQAIPINFAQGLDTKNDPFQLSIGSFLSLKNSVFTKGKRLTKRNGYGALAALPHAASFATTFNDDLTVIGENIQAYLSGSDTWVTKGTIKPVDLDTMPLIRNNTNQSQSDTAISESGLICTVYTDQDPSNLNNKLYKYVVADVSTGQNVISPTTIAGADATAGTPRGTPKVFLLGRYFIIVFTNLVGATYHLKYMAVGASDPTVVIPATDISTSYTPASTLSFDGVVFSNALYIAWNGASASGIKMAYITSTMPGSLSPVSPTVIVDAAHSATLMSVCADAVNNVIWAVYYNLTGTVGYAVAVTPQLSAVLSATQIIPSGTVLNITSTAASGVMTFLYEVSNNYAWDSIPSHFVSKNTLTQAGSLGASSVMLRSVGLASKSFIIDSTIYCLIVYVSPYQSTYFLTDISGNTVSKLAYGNASSYLITGLPSVAVNGNAAQVSYLIKDAIQSVNKNTNVPSGTQTDGIYSQLGINLAYFDIGTTDIVSAEIGNNLNISGGFLWAYDGYLPVEQGFFLYPDSVKVTTSSAGGGINIAQKYYYQVTYEWTDNQGNAFRSSPSIPVSVTTTGTTSTNTIQVPTLRLTYKTSNPVKIVVYRWSTAQQAYYQVTSISTPTLNSTSSDSVTITDTFSDSTILGNNLLYTTGGVIENIGPPGTSAVTLFDDRLWLVDAEDKNLLWFSKQVIESTPVEMSDLLTVYVAPSIGATGPTGKIRALSAMDDKLIVFKKNAVYYINGAGPDSTGANNQYSQPTFVTSMVGCSNPRSIVFQPQGLMFEFSSESGNQIWMLSRDLQTQYIGAPVEELTKNSTILSSIAVPGTNQVRFNLSSGITLMYDYFYGQWGIFTTNAASSTLFQGFHTYIGPTGAVYQETPGRYLDGSTPVLLSFTTSWINLAGLTGYERAFFFFIQGQYFSPFKLACSVGYDYESAPSTFTLVQPTNFNPTYGGSESNGQNTVYGTGTPYGGPGNTLSERVFMKIQRCSAFQVTIQEIYDPSFGVPAGEGLNLSGLSMVCAIKSGFKTISSKNSVGAS